MLTRIISTIEFEKAHAAKIREKEKTIYDPNPLTWDCSLISYWLFESRFQLTQAFQARLDNLKP